MIGPYTGPVLLINPTGSTNIYYSPILYTTNVNTIVGGVNHVVNGLQANSTIAGGNTNSLLSTLNSFIGSGYANSITSANYSSIKSGFQNVINLTAATNVLTGGNCIGGGGYNTLHGATGRL